MIGLDLLGASAPACPICGAARLARCMCAIGDSKCVRGHEWHRCPAHGRTLQGPGDHSLPDGACQCHRSLTIGHERRPDCPPLTHCTDYGLPTDGRPAKGWSQPRPDLMGAAVVPTIGAVSISALDAQLRAIKPVTVGIAGAILRGGLRAIDAARTVAAARGLPGGGKRDECYWKLQWHKDALAKQSGTPNAAYGAAADLKVWVSQAFKEWNAAEEGSARLEGAAAEMWAEIKAGIAALPEDVARKLDEGVSLVKWVVGGVLAIAVIVGGVVVVRQVRR